jgi:hypothetical protein
LTIGRSPLMVSTTELKNSSAVIDPPISPSLPAGVTPLDGGALGAETDADHRLFAAPPL